MALLAKFDTWPRRNLNLNVQDRPPRTRDPPLQSFRHTLSSLQRITEASSNGSPLIGSWVCPAYPPTGYKTWQPPRGRQSQHRGIPPPAPVPPDSLGSVSSEAMGGPPIHSPVGKPSAASGRLLAATLPLYLSGAVRGWAATEGDPLCSTPAACGFGISSWHPAQLFLCDLAPAKPLSLVLPGPPDSCAHIPGQLPSALPGNLKYQARAFPQVPARSSPPAAAGSPA